MLFRSGGLGGLVGTDHCLQSDLRHIYPSSPNSLTLYENNDQLESARSLTSSASDGLGDVAQLEDLDCNNESLKLDLDSLLCPSFEDNYVRGDTVWSPTEPSLLKMEDVFQVDKSDVIQGPTLAQLNGEDSLSVLDDIVTLLGNDYDPTKGVMWGGVNYNLQSFVPSSMMQQHAPQQHHGHQSPPHQSHHQQQQQQRSCTSTISSPNMMPSQSATSPPIPIPRRDASVAAAAGAAGPVLSSSSSLSPHQSHMEALSPHMGSNIPAAAMHHQQSQQSPPRIKQEPYHISAKFSVYSPVSPVSGVQSVQGGNSATSPNLVCNRPPMPNHGNLSPNLSSPSSRSISSTPKKQSLQEYLDAPPYTPNISSSNNNHNQTTVKRDPSSTPMPVVKQEPMDFENLSAQSMDKKWEEIKQFIDEGERSRMHQAASLGSPINIAPKNEPQDVAFSPSEDMESSSLKIDEDETEVETNADSDSEAETMDGDYDHAEFLLSEAESDSEDLGSQGRTGTKKQKRYFWQYNTQAKGPKGKRLCKSVTNYDPHVLASFEDPVFDPDLNQMSYKHNGKARKGDGNDITPNPLKLYQIGQELKKLTRTINDLRPVNELPVNVRSRSRKEKNKLASRACRLKKKAQHEANKLKLYGLDNEHKSLMKVINALKKNFVSTIKDGEIKMAESSALYVELYNSHVQQYLTGKVAGHTAKYVNSVLAKVSSGDSTGGIN